MPPSPRAAALRDLGYAAYRQGNYPRALQHFERALALSEPDSAEAATAYSDLGATCAAMGDAVGALRHHQAALAFRRAGHHPADLAATLHNIGITRRGLGQLDQAEACHLEALALWQESLGPGHPTVARAMSALGVVARLAGRLEAALDWHEQALRLRQAAAPPVPADIAVSLDDLAADHAARQDFAAAEHCWRQALALRQALARRQSTGAISLAPTLNNLGVACRNQRKWAEAATFFEAALKAQPGLLTAQHNLAACLSRAGRHAEANRHRNQALARQNLFMQPAPVPNAPRLLILSGADEGNVPLEHVLPEHAVTRIWWFPAHGAAVSQELPEYDVAFNGVGDADLAAATDPVIHAFLRGATKPVLNHPAAIARTRRDLLPATLAPIAHCVVPQMVRLEAAPCRSAIAAAGIHPPFLLRPAGSHGGAGILRIDAWQDLDAEKLGQAPVWYASEFVNTSGADGYFRKYRIIYIDRVPYPYHLAISPDWLVHYFSADMPAHAWKCAEEARFLADWQTTLGEKAAQAIADIGRQLGLEYCGIDFTLLPNGQLLVFEANATMLIHPEPPESKLAYKNPSTAKITSAMLSLVRKPH
jgi:tetratricopeptide (TPR) repeat protein/glutathione synthase/RimK-type ligase-like ATP-grasp enzyme